MHSTFLALRYCFAAKSNANWSFAVGRVEKSWRRNLGSFDSLAGCMISCRCVQAGVMPLDQRPRSECPVHGKSLAQHFGNRSDNRFR